MSQRERWAEMRELESQRRDLYDDLRTEWKANEDGDTIPGLVADLENVRVQNHKTREPEWEEYLTENGQLWFAKLCNVDERLSELECEEDDDSVREAAEAYYHH